MFKKPCLFCKSIAIVNDQIFNVWWVSCPVCGNYGILHTTLDDYAFQNTKSQAVTDYEKAVEIFPTNPNVIRKNILSENKIIWKSQSDTAHLDSSLSHIPLEILEDFSLEKMPLVHDQKPSHILKLINDKVQSKSSPFDEVSVTLKDVYRLGICGGDELWKWIEFLQDRGLIEDVAHFKQWEKQDSWSFSLTPSGLSTMQEYPESGNFVFIALQFSDDKWTEVSTSEEAFSKSNVQAAIQEACAECGFRAESVDFIPHNEKICERIIGLINQSKFVIADLTGQNQGVYYEAGFAKGQGKDVVYTVYDGDGENVHFDNRQYNQVRWKNLSELKQKLKDHIKACFKNRSSKNE